MERKLALQEQDKMERVQEEIKNKHYKMLYKRSTHKAKKTQTTQTTYQNYFLFNQQREHYLYKC